MKTQSHSQFKILLAIFLILFCTVAIPVARVHADDDDDDDDSYYVAPVVPGAPAGDDTQDQGPNTENDIQPGDPGPDGPCQGSCAANGGGDPNVPPLGPATWSGDHWSTPSGTNGGSGSGEGCGFLCSTTPKTPFCAQNPTDPSCVTPPGCGGFSYCSPTGPNPTCVGSNCSDVTPKLCYVHASSGYVPASNGNTSGAANSNGSDSGGASLVDASNSNPGENGGGSDSGGETSGGSGDLSAVGGGGDNTYSYWYWCHPIPKPCVSQAECNSNGDSIDSCNPSHVIAYAAACSYGFECSSGTCNPPPAPVVTDFSVHPTLVSSGEITNISWNVNNVGGCTVTGTDGDSWTTTSGTQVSKPLTSQTIFTLSCTAITGAENADGSTATWTDQTRTVNIVPTFQEK